MSIKVIDTLDKKEGFSQTNKNRSKIYLPNFLSSIKVAKVWHVAGFCDKITVHVLLKFTQTNKNKMAEAIHVTNGFHKYFATMMSWILHHHITCS